MSALLDAIAFCGTEVELARRLSSRLGRQIKPGHIYYWKRSGFSRACREDVVPAIEFVTGGQSRCEALCPEVRWLRDPSGAVTGHVVPVSSGGAAELVDPVPGLPASRKSQ